jgi:hypothetical protein
VTNTAARFSLGDSLAMEAGMSLMRDSSRGIYYGENRTKMTSPTEIDRDYFNFKPIIDSTPP